MITDGAVFLIFLVFAISVSAQTEDMGYESGGRRDPFVPLVTQKVKSTTDGLQGVQGIGDIILEGIVWEPTGRSIAIMNGAIVKEGDRAGAVRIEKIEEKRVILYINEVKHELALGGEGET